MSEIKNWEKLLSLEITHFLTDSRDLSPGVQLVGLSAKTASLLTERLEEAIRSAILNMLLTDNSPQKWNERFTGS